MKYEKANNLTSIGKKILPANPNCKNKRVKWLWNKNKTKSYKNKHNKNAKALLDSGAIARSSTISAEVANWLVQHDTISIVEPKLVCSWFNECKYITSYIQTDINFDKHTVNNQIIENVIINLKLWIVIDELPSFGNNDIESNLELSQMFHTKFDFELTNRNTSLSKVYKIK